MIGNTCIGITVQLVEDATRKVIEGVTDILKESAKQHRLKGDKGHARMCELHAAELKELSPSSSEDKETLRFDQLVSDLRQVELNRVNYVFLRDCIRRCKE